MCVCVWIFVWVWISVVSLSVHVCLYYVFILSVIEHIMINITSFEMNINIRTLQICSSNFVTLFPSYFVKWSPFISLWSSSRTMIKDVWCSLFILKSMIINQKAYLVTHQSATRLEVESQNNIYRAPKHDQRPFFKQVPGCGIIFEVKESKIYTRARRRKARSTCHSHPGFEPESIAFGTIVLPLHHEDVR